MCSLDLCSICHSPKQTKTGKIQDAYSLRTKNAMHTTPHLWFIIDAIIIQDDNDPCCAPRTFDRSPSSNSSHSFALIWCFFDDWQCMMQEGREWDERRRRPDTITLGVRAIEVGQQIKIVGCLAIVDWTIISLCIVVTTSDGLIWLTSFEMPEPCGSRLLCSLNVEEIQFQSHQQRDWAKVSPATVCFIRFRYERNGSKLHI